MARVTKKELMEMEVRQAKEELKQILLQHNHQVYTKLEHVSRSGMLRRISVYVINGEYRRDITSLVAKVTGYKEDNKHYGLRVSGCGMDMGFAVVYDLSTTLYRNDDGSYSHDGAYRLKQHWL